MKLSDKNVKLNYGGGTGILTILQIVFIVLKLTNTIDWSWWIVLIPAYVAVALGAVGIACIILAVVCQIFIDYLDN